MSQSRFRRPRSPFLREEEKVRWRLRRRQRQPESEIVSSIGRLILPILRKYRLRSVSYTHLVADKKEARENPAVVKAVEAVAEALGDDGRILVRESGTEPVIRVMVEAATDELCEKYVNQVVDVIKAEGLMIE